MTKTNISKTIQDILDIFFKHNFPRYSYNNLAAILNLKLDTVIQRIRRNIEYFELDDNQRPTQISVKKGIKEIYFYRDKNKCHLCKQVNDPENLEIKLRNPHSYDKYNWRNVVTVCDKCKDQDIIKRVKITRKKGNFEYKELIIRLVSEMNALGEREWFYEFDELDGVGWFPLIDENNNISSTTIASILNYFGSEGWDVVYINEKIEEYSDRGDFQVILKRKNKGGD